MCRENCAFVRLNALIEHSELLGQQTGQPDDALISIYRRIGSIMFQVAWREVWSCDHL
jgi:hypothetical protein